MMLLAQAGQGVVFTEKADHRPAAAKAGPERRGQTADASLDREALVLQFLTQQVRRAPFLKADLGSIPELVGYTG